MDKFISLEKKSKKAQREHLQCQRGSWGDLNPVPRVVPDTKKYSRADTHQDARKIIAEM